MDELISRIMEKTGISAGEATKVLETIKEYVIEKFPMMAGAVDNLFPGGETGAADTTAIVDPGAPALTAEEKHSILDKISDMIPGQTGEKVEGFVKGAADKAEDTYDAIKDKISGMFGDKT